MSVRKMILVPVEKYKSLSAEQQQPVRVVTEAPAVPSSPVLTSKSFKPQSENTAPQGLTAPVFKNLPLETVTKQVALPPGDVKTNTKVDTLPKGIRELLTKAQASKKKKPPKRVKWLTM